MKKSDQDRLEAIDEARKTVAECAATLESAKETHKEAKMAYDTAVNELLHAIDGEYENLYNQGDAEEES